MCDESALESSHLSRTAPSNGRAQPLMVCGSIHTQDELDTLRQALPVELRSGCQEMIELLYRYPWMSFEQALDVCMGTAPIGVGDWGLRKRCSELSSRR